MMLMTSKRGGSTWGRPCDTCGASPCRLFCRADAATQLLCDACERSPALFLCKADSASLCASCDSDIHSANPLARRHIRVPILPASGPNRGSMLALAMADLEDDFDEEDEDEAASWLLPNPSTHTNADTAASGCFPGSGVDQYLDLVDYTTCGVGDSMVPNPNVHGIGKDAYQMDVDFDIKSGYAYNSSSISHNVSLPSGVSVSSSTEVGIVPESSTMSDISTTPSQGTIDLYSCPPLQQVPMQLSPMDRQARVLRYWQKKKTRKFEKTIRYASRKAYAEKRPRIKGRFAKRTDAQDHDQVGHMFAHAGYGIVPSF